ncbi:uncharacterized protein LOC144434608 [Glandiceps talaboti]
MSFLNFSTIGEELSSSEPACEYTFHCQNGGVCESDGTCSCPSRYSGTHCEDRSSDCTLIYDCNNGYCSSQGTCVCDYGYSGTHCQINGESDDNADSSSSNDHYIIVAAIVAVCIVAAICICRFRMHSSHSASTITHSSATSAVSGALPPTSDASRQEYQYRPSWYQPFDQQERNVRVPPPTSEAPIAMQTIATSPAGQTAPTAPPNLSNDYPPTYGAVAPTNEQSGLPPPPSYEAALLISDSAATSEPSAPPLPLPGDSS